MVGKLHLKSFGDYVLINKVAGGGMADVFKAHVVWIRGFFKSVAVKRIHAHLGDFLHDESSEEWTLGLVYLLRELGLMDLQTP